MSPAMQYYLIEPKDPLVIRSGRPFEEISDTEAARFPPPSTLAGALRNAHARSTGKPLNSTLEDIPIFGPLPVKVTESEALTTADIMVPKPADAHYYFDNVGRPELVRARPQALADDEGCDLPKGLKPVQIAQAIKGKPAPGPHWWSLSDLLAWRESAEELTFDTLQQNGWVPTPADIRTHIALKNATRAPETGQIFQTTGLTLWQQPGDDSPFPTTPIGILGGICEDVATGWVNLGGERRLATVKPCTPAVNPPETLAATILESGGLVLTLLTPALFDGGWRPGWIDPDTLEGHPPGHPNVHLKLQAAAVGRWQPHSGWNLDKRRPRAGRKAVPAGTTYWFELLEPSPSAEELAALWLSSLCDALQDNRNGFGLVLPSALSREL